MLFPLRTRARKARGGHASASEGRSESDRAERKDARPGLDCPTIADPGRPAADGVSLGGVSLAEEDRKHKMPTEMPVCFPLERHWADHGLACLNVRQRSSA